LYIVSVPFSLKPCSNKVFLNVFSGTQSDACVLRESFVQLFVSLSLHNDLSGEALEEALADARPHGSGRHLGAFASGWIDMNNLLIGSHDLGASLHTVHIGHELLDSCNAHYGCELNDLREKVAEGIVTHEGECVYLSSSSGFWNEVNPTNSCSQQMHILCQKVSLEYQNQLQFHSFNGNSGNFYTQNDLIVTHNQYPLSEADIACGYERGSEYVAYHGDVENISLPIDHNTLGTGSIYLGDNGGGYSDSSEKSKKRSRIDSDIRDNFIDVKKMKLAESPASISEFNRKKYNMLKLHEINVGAGQCQLVQCVPTDNDGEVIESQVESALVDCGSNGFSGFAKTPAATVSYLKDAYFYDSEEVAPTLFLSHSDRDHVNRILPIMNYENSLPNAIFLGGEPDNYITSPSRQVFRTWLHEQMRENVEVNGFIGSVEDIPRWPITNTNANITFEHCGDATLKPIVVNTAPVYTSRSYLMNVPSAVMQLSYLHESEAFYSAVMPGDAVRETELNAMYAFTYAYIHPANYIHRLLISSHHGSDTFNSNHSDWLNTINPTSVLYSSGQSHGHPHKEVVTRFSLLPLTFDSQHDLVQGTNISGRRIYETIRPSKSHYSTFSSDTIVSTVFIPKQTENIGPVHRLSLQ